MKTISKLLSVALFCAGISGCGSDGESLALKPSYDSPRIAQGAIFALVVDIDGASAHLNELLVDILGKRKAEEIIPKISLSNPDIPEDLRIFLDESGLGKADFEWVAYSCGTPEFKVSGNGDLAEPESIPDLAFVVRVDHDFAKISELLKKQAAKKGKDQFEDGRISGEDVLIARPVDKDDVKFMEQTGLEPVIGSVEGKLLVAATSPKAFSDQVALYRDGKGASADFKDFKADPIRLKVTGLDILSRKMARTFAESAAGDDPVELRRARGLADNIDDPKVRERIVRELGGNMVPADVCVVLDIRSICMWCDNGKTKIEIDTRSEDAAQKILGFLHMGLVMGKMGIKNLPDGEEFDKIARIVNSIRINAKDETVLAEADVHLVGVVAAPMAAVVPAIDKAIKKANSAAGARPPRR